VDRPFETAGFIGLGIMGGGGQSLS
jgi:hypothetical protein